MPATLDIRPLRAQDIPNALRLSTQAGWNQIDADWQRLIDLWPSTCLAGWREGQLVATATLAIYGDQLAWVGMILVDEACRGQGFGGQIMDAILHVADQSSVKSIGLDATDAGRPVYLKRGFVDVCGIDRRRAANLPVVQPGATTALRERDWPALLVFDRQQVGFDRSALLAHLRAESGTSIAVVRDESSFDGYGIRRPGRGADQVGPVVVAHPGAAEALIDRLTGGAGDVILDTFRGEAFSTSLDNRGLAVSRRLTRMTRPARVDLPQPICAAGFELG
jgi:GNAT superfamily N-acetyltransferase